MVENPQAHLKQMQNTLGKFDQALGSISESLIWINEQGYIEWCNAVFVQLSSQLRVQVLGNLVDHIISVSDENGPVSIFEYIKKSASSNKTQIVTFLKDNNKILLEIDAKNVTSQDNKMYIIVVLSDITEKQKMLYDLKLKDKELTDLSNYLNDIVQSISNMLIVTTNDFIIKLVNRATLATLGYRSESELIGKNLDSILVQPGKVSEPIETHYKKSDGTLIPVIFSSTLLKKLSSQSADIVCVAQDISELKKAEEEIVYLASHDVLTDLPNRAEFEKLLSREVTRQVRYKTKMAVLFIDIDNFKHINDSLGHEIGDLVLVEVGKRLKTATRDSDMVARPTQMEHFIGRLGGDEFVVLLTDLKDEIDAAVFAKRIISDFSESFFVNNFELHVTLSIGIALSAYAGQSSDELIKNADIAMYHVKKRGRNNFEFFTESLNEIYKKRLELETGLHIALQQHHFHLVYQPQYTSDGGIIRGVEVLLRWSSPHLGEIPPATFIPVAEKSGLIVPIGTWVLREACVQCKRWESSGLFKQGMKLSINVSPYQLIHDEFIKSIHTILAETGLSASLLEFEITETALMTELEGSENVLNELRNIGIDIAIDDFGTGYSSLARIKELPINTLKIDKSFIQKLSLDADDAVIVKSIIALSKALGLTVVAEGVEEKGQASYLHDNGCELIQGFYYSKPLTPILLEKLLKSTDKR